MSVCLFVKMGFNRVQDSSGQLNVCFCRMLDKSGHLNVCFSRV